jgi:hypothetical protein
MIQAEAQDSVGGQVEEACLGVGLMIQAEAQDSVGGPKLLCEEVGIQAWWDMEAEELTEMDMVRTILGSEFFCVYLTASYLTSWFCRLEIATAI